jgi:hypothetical protein
VLALACTAACGFQGAADHDAAPIDTAPPPDAEVADAPIDAIPPGRTRDGLIGLWTFDEAQGATIADTSDATKKVPLTVTTGSVTFAAGRMSPDGTAVIASGPMPHVNADVIASRAVTLEAWLVPAAAAQGSDAQPAMVAGLCSSIVSRNLSILQSGTHWVARIRTTSDRDGKPSLVSTAEVTAGALTHVVIVSDATRRALYINGKLDVADAQPTPPAGWDKAYKVALGNELAQGRQWAGAFDLVALYQRALTPTEIAAAYAAGSSAR